MNSAILRVPSDLVSIQSAVDFAQPRDTVLLENGIFAEAVYAPAKGLTIAGNYLFSGDTNDINLCVWRGLSNGDDTLRCLTAEDESGPIPTIRIVGIRFAGSSAHNNEEGGAVRLFAQDASIEYSIFDSCKAGYGGAVAVRQASATFKNCKFVSCGANRLAAALRLVEAQVLVQSCTIENSLAFHEVEEIPEQIAMRQSNLRIENSQVFDCGWNHNPNGTYFVYVSKPPDTLEIVATEFRDNYLTNAVHVGGNYVNFLRIDSCHFHDNNLTGGVYLQSGPDSLTTFQAIGNVFESFSPVPMRGMHGVFGLDGRRSRVTIVNNLFLHNTGGHTSFGTILGHNREPRIVQHNYIMENSNFSVTWPPSGQVLTIANDSTDLTQNLFLGNLGYAVYQGPLNGTPFAQHNYWNHPTGPYDSVSNPGGLGDTVEWRINYVPFESDTAFMQAVELPEPRTEIPNAFIGNSYPNPFNGSVTIEFVLLHDQLVSLDIYDLTGRHVQNILKGKINKGVHIRSWQPDARASGIYFARLSGNSGLVSTAKLLYLK